MTDHPVTVTLSEKEWEEIIYGKGSSLSSVPSRFILIIENAIAEQSEPAGDWSCD